jgi:penicillin-binding protein A
VNGPARRLVAALMGGFLVLLAATTWYQVIAVDRYRDDPRNARTAISRAGKERGVIVTADGTVLARSVPDSDLPQSYLREYPGGPAFTHVVGYISRLAGSTGLELAFADELRSKRDLTISDLLAVLLGRDLRPNSLQITIDPAVHQVALDALDGRRGAIVAIQPSTGDVLVLVSSPSYDASLLLGPGAIAERRRLLDDPDEPLRDRATKELAAPGSTFKTVVAGAAFDSGVAGPETEYLDLATFPLPGSTATISNYDGEQCGSGDTVTVSLGYVRSCNTVFAQLGIDVGAVPMGETAEAVGFNRTIRFPWEVAVSAFPTRALANDDAALAQSSLGERDVRATPLVMAMTAAAVANGGELMQPRLVTQLFDADGQTVEEYPVATLGRSLSPATAAVLSQMMERVVTEGTGRRAAIPGVRVAGKTGTAQSSGAGAPDVWFIGFAPVEAPSIAVAVMLEDGGGAGESATGGSVAAPIAARIIEAWLSPRD